MNVYNVSLSILLALSVSLNGCSVRPPTKEEKEFADKNNLHGEMPAEYKVLIKDYLKTKLNLPRGLVNQLNISEPTKTYYKYRAKKSTLWESDKITMWWGWVSIVGMAETNLNQFGEYKESSVFGGEKVGTKKTIEKTYLFRTSRFYIKENKVFGNSPVSYKDHAVTMTKQVTLGVSSLNDEQLEGSKTD